MVTCSNKCIDRRLFGIIFTQMDLSTDHKMQEQYPFIKNRNEPVINKPAASKSNAEFDIIDITKIRFDNDETW